MGRITHDPTIQHFSHPHPLHLSSQTHHHHPCANCTLPIASSHWTYSCHHQYCNFHLHISCSQMPPLIRHPSHPPHPLTLLPTPAYAEGYFDCDACGATGSGFSYHCSECDVDLHTLCASMPLSVSHHAHVHPLSIAFSSPYDNKGFSCDGCGSLGGNHWLYRCALCEFDVHLGCGGGGGGRQEGVIGRVGSGGGRLMRVAVEGLVDGAAQQIGQTLVQGLMGGGDGGGSGSGDGLSLNLNGAVDLGSAILGTVLGGGSAQRLL